MTYIDKVGTVFYGGFSSVILWSPVLSDQYKHCSGHSVTTQACTVDGGSCGVLRSCGSLLLFFRQAIMNIKKMEWNLKLNITIFIHKKSISIIIYKIAAIFARS